MEGGEIGVAFLDDERAERETQGNVVDGVGFGGVGDLGVGYGDLH